MQKESIKFQSSTILEGMTSLRALFDGRDTEINDRPIHTVFYDGAKRKSLFREIGYLRAMADKHGFVLQEASNEEIEKMALGTTHGGVIAVCGERTLLPLELTAKNLPQNGFYAMIQGIEDPYNFGYALRSLYACGIDGLILSERNWLSAAGVVARSSAGASERLPVFVAEPDNAVALFQRNGYAVVCADERTDNILQHTELKKPLLLIVGGERRGISRNILDAADIIVKIPYAREFRASLSAASAATILAYEVMRQNSANELLP